MKSARCTCFLSATFSGCCLPLFRVLQGGIITSQLGDVESIIVRRRNIEGEAKFTRFKVYFIKITSLNFINFRVIENLYDY